MTSTMRWTLEPVLCRVKEAAGGQISLRFYWLIPARLNSLPKIRAGNRIRPAAASVRRLSAASHGAHGSTGCPCLGDVAMTVGVSAMAHYIRSFFGSFAIGAAILSFVGRAIAGGIFAFFLLWHRLSSSVRAELRMRTPGSMQTAGARMESVEFAPRAKVFEFERHPTSLR